MWISLGARVKIAEESWKFRLDTVLIATNFRRSRAVNLIEAELTIYLDFLSSFINFFIYLQLLIKKLFEFEGKWVKSRKFVGKVLEFFPRIHKKYESNHASRENFSKFKRNREPILEKSWRKSKKSWREPEKNFEGNQQILKEIKKSWREPKNWFKSQQNFLESRKNESIWRSLEASTWKVSGKFPINIENSAI